MTRIVAPRSETCYTVLMTDSFLQYIAEKKAKILKQKQRLENDLADLEKTERLYYASGAARENKKPNKRFTQDAASFIGTIEGLPKDATIKMRVMKILSNEPNGLTSSSLVLTLQNSGLPNLKRESLSPQLTRLKKNGLIVLENGVWKTTNPTNDGKVEVASQIEDLTEECRTQEKGYEDMLS